MGLQIWLPMNGNLNNQGLNSSTATGGVVNSNGKIGMCYLVNKSTPITINQSVSTTSEWSIAFWAKLPASMGNATAWETMFVFPTINSNAGSNSSNVISWTSYYNIKIWDETNHQWFWAAPGKDFNYDMWHHWVITNTANGDGVQCKIYIDGNLIGTYNNTTHQLKIRSGNITIGSGISTGGFYINDFRLYDKELDANQIKKISMGLIAHYPLSDGFGGENICKVWDVSLSGSDYGAYSTRTYDTTTHIGKIQVTSTNNKWNAWRFGTSDLDTPCTTLTTGTNTYTMSVDIKVTNYTSGTIRCDFDFRTNNVVSSLATVTLTAEQCNGKWHRVSSSLTTNNQQNTACLWCINSNNTIHGSQTTIEYKNWKLERGDKATPWIPNKSNSDYSKIGLNSNIAYDVSGYGNNGTKSGTISYSSDTPRYNVSTGFDGSQYIQLPFPCGMISEAVTVACWGYESNWNTTYAERLIGAATGSSGWCIGDYGSENTLFAFYANGSYNTASGFKQLSDGWHYFVITFDGINLKYYVDGVLFSSKTFSTKQSATGVYNIQIGQHYGGACSFKGKISDVRIYATALSAEDILELYKTPSYLASNAS